MNLEEFKEKLNSQEESLPLIKEGQKVKGNVLKRSESGVLVSCADGAFTGIILPKEAKELERNGFDLSLNAELEAEILNPDIRESEGYFVISISKLLQYDYWQNLLEKHQKNETLTVIPTEANLGGLLIDIHGIKGFIPLSQLAPVHYPRVEDGDQEKIFESLLNLVGKEFQVRVINIDEENKRMILSEREALREEREKILENLDIGNEYEGIISGVSSYGLFVTIGGGIEGLVHVSEITYGHVENINKFGNVGDEVKVKVIGHDEGKISLSMKQLKPDPWTVIPEKYQVGDLVEGEVVRFVPYGAFIRLYDDINGLIHLSEMSDKSITNPAEVLKLGQKVKAKLILLDPKKRKAGLSIKALQQDESKSKKSGTTKSSTSRSSTNKKTTSSTSRTTSRSTTAKKSTSTKSNSQEKSESSSSDE